MSEEIFDIVNDRDEVIGQRPRREVHRLGLMHRGEYGNTPGGLLRWDRATEQTKKYPLRAVANAISHSQTRLYVATQDGIAVLKGQFVEFYVVELTLRGNYRVVPAF